MTDNIDITINLGNKFSESIEARSLMLLFPEKAKKIRNNCKIDKRKEASKLIGSYHKLPKRRQHKF